MSLHPLWLMAPDEDQFTQRDTGAIIRLRPQGLLVMRYPWPFDKGAASQIMHCVAALGHTKLVVRFHDEGVPQKSPEYWARDCVARMHIYESLRSAGVELHGIPGNEMNLPLEGGHTDWTRHADWLRRFAQVWKNETDDKLHLPAPARMPIEGHEWDTWNESLAYWSAMGDVQGLYDYIDVHHYRGDTTRAVAEARSVFPYRHDDLWGTECNGEGVMAEAISLISGGWLKAATWFSLSWRNMNENGEVLGGPNRNEDIPMSILEHPHLEEEWFSSWQQSEQPMVPAPPEPEIDSDTEEQTPPEEQPGSEATSPPLEIQPMREYSEAEIVQISNATADAYNIPRLLLLACACAESDLTTNARRPPTQDKDLLYWSPPDPFDVSAGVWQQTVRYDPDYRGDDTFDHGEILRIITLQLDPWRSARIAAVNLNTKFRHVGGSPNDYGDDEILKALYLYNWPAGGGRPYTPAHETNYTRGLRQAKTLLSLSTPPTLPYDGIGYNIDVPVLYQPNNWACSVFSLTMLLHAIHDRVDWTTVLRWMGLRVTEEYGLMDASGAGVVATLNEQGYIARNNGNISLDDVLRLAGVVPVMLGGRSWNHWSYVKGKQGRSLTLGNPAPNWQGVGSTLDESEWQRFGSWSAVWLPEDNLEMLRQLKADLAGKDAEIEAVKAWGREEERRKFSLVHTLAHVVDVTIPVLCEDRVTKATKKSSLALAKDIRKKQLDS